MTVRAAPSAKDKKRFQRAMQLLNEGGAKQALGLFNEVRKSWGNDPDIWYLIGLAHGKLGEMVEVERVSRKALEMNPDHFGALCSLANAQMALGRQNEALENYQKSLAINPKDPTLLDNYGRALAGLGRLDEAMECYQKSLNLNPAYAPGYAAMGKGLVQLGRPEEAYEPYQTALRYDPNLVEAHLGLAHLYARAGAIRKSEQHYREALRIQPEFIDGYLGMGDLRQRQGDMEGALESFAQAERVSASNPFVLVAKADVLQRMGRDEDAYELLRGIGLDFRLPPLGVEVFSRVCRKFDACEDALMLLRASIASPTIDLMPKQGLQYEMGRLLDKLGRYDEAFDCYKAANEVIDITFDGQALKERIDKLISVFSKEAMAVFPRAKVDTARPIFILGMPRSGTTLLEQVLATHEDVFGGGELPYIERMAGEIGRRFSVGEKNWMDAISDIDSNMLTELADQYLSEIGGLDSKARFVTDKMPHNFLTIGLINLLFPKARIIHCRRDPLDTGLSIYFQNFLWMHDYATDLGNIGIFYNEYSRLMSHWEQVVDNPMLTVDYEEMVDDAEQVSRRVLDFCGLEWCDTVMDFHKNKRIVSTASFEQVRQPIYKGSKARWKNYEQHIDPLRKVLSGTTGVG